LAQEIFSFQFPDAEQYAFLFENVHLVMLTWERDNAKFLFRIGSHREDGVLELAYPGKTFNDRVLDTLESIFFVQVQEEGGNPASYVLGSYFEVQGQMFGAYYERDVAEQPGVVLFKIVGDAPEQQLEVPEEAEYKAAVEAFSAQHADIVEIDEANNR
jgi:hypothetical protein